MGKKFDWSQLSFDNLKQRAHLFKMQVFRIKNWLKYIAWGRVRLFVTRQLEKWLRREYRLYVFKLVFFVLILFFSLCTFSAQII